MSLTTVTDSACGKMIYWDGAAGVLRCRGRLYYFCCKGWEKFRHTPARFAG